MDHWREGRVLELIFDEMKMTYGRIVTIEYDHNIVKKNFYDESLPHGMEGRA